jgi:hypothetical protein
MTSNQLPDLKFPSRQERQPPAVRVSPEWLAVREPADAAARAADLADRVVHHQPAGRWVIHDLGSGTGSMTRWLAPRLTGEQRWILHDRDPDLLARATADLLNATDSDTDTDRDTNTDCDSDTDRDTNTDCDTDRDSECGPMVVERRCGDITRLGPAELTGATLITASALLDILTADELHRLVDACAGARCPVLLTVSVAGRVELTPADPLDGFITSAFNAHQCRVVAGHRLLGPDAVGLAVDAFGRLGFDVLVRPSPWQLGPATPLLLTQWLLGWLTAAAEQRPDMAAAIHEYERRREQQAAAGMLAVIVHHHDLLALPQ